MSNLKRSSEYREAKEVCSKNEASAPSAPPPAGNRLGGSLPGAELATANSRGRSRGIITHLNLSERIEIQSGLRAGDTQVTVALKLNRSAGAISMELKRNGGRAGYCATRAHAVALSRRGASQRGRCDIAACPPLRDEVHARLRRGWSPEEVAGTLKFEHPQLTSMHTSHESIYRYVYIVAVGELKRELVKCLRRSHRVRKPRRRGVTATQGKIPDMVLIDERPAEVEFRLIAGHYEGDLILGEGNRSAVGVLVERTTRYTMLCRLEQKDATSVREAFTRRLVDIPSQLRLSLTYDQGKEMTQHKTLAADLGLKVFFCHPHSPWERGTCESQNGRIRHYLPKGSDLSLISYQQLAAYQEMLNERPRKILGWKSPAQCFHDLISKNVHVQS